MKCPNCNETLLMIERNHIEIDYCPGCRGVWLEKGELDKMLEYAGQASSYQNDMRPGYAEHRLYNTKPYNYNKPHKKRSFLSDLFDFD
jgi:hypothetical protein